MDKNRGILIKLLVLTTYVLMVVVNGLANALPINGVTTGQVSDAYADLFAPAPVTFAIWGLIYILLAGYTLFQLGLFQGDRGSVRAELFQKVGIIFSISSIANVLWILAWHYNLIGLSLLLMIVILISLILIATRLNKEQFTFKEKIFIALPFTIYFAWITVATIANVTTFLVSIGWDGFGISEQAWTVIVLIVGVIIGILPMLKDKTYAYGLIIIWAYTGILLKHTSLTYFAGQYPAVITTAIISIILLLIGEGFLAFSGARKAT